MSDIPSPYDPSAKPPETRNRRSESGPFIYASGAIAWKGLIFRIVDGKIRWENSGKVDLQATHEADPPSQLLEDEDGAPYPQAIQSLLAAKDAELAHTVQERDDAYATIRTMISQAVDRVLMGIAKEHQAKPYSYASGKVYHHGYVFTVEGSAVMWRVAGTAPTFPPVRLGYDPGKGDDHSVVVEAQQSPNGRVTVALGPGHRAPIDWQYSYTRQCAIDRINSQPDPLLADLVAIIDGMMNQTQAIKKL